MPEVSSHYRVVVKCFASGQCGPGSQAGAEVGADAYIPPNIGILWYLVCSNFIIVVCTFAHWLCTLASWLPSYLNNHQYSYYLTGQTCRFIVMVKGTVSGDFRHVLFFS